MAQYVGIKEASALVGLSVTALRRGVKDGRFAAVRVGGTPKSKLMFDLQALAQKLADEAYQGMQANNEKDGE